MPEEQYFELEKMVVEAAADNLIERTCPVMVRMSQELIDEKLEQIKDWMAFCWEAVRSDSTERNFLRLFGMKEMAEKYGLKGKEIINNRKKGKTDHYVGDFARIKEASKNPKGSLGWSGGFIPYGIRMILLYLYDRPIPSKAAVGIAAYVGFQDADSSESMMGFERDILEESCKHKTSIFWNYF